MQRLKVCQRRRRLPFCGVLKKF